MAFHAYTKKQFKELGFDTSDYRDLDTCDYGKTFAKLDCKRWGTKSMFLYLTLENGDHVFATAFISTDYFGFKDIPIGAIVEIDVAYNDRAQCPVIVGARLMEGISSIQEAIALRNAERKNEDTQNVVARILKAVHCLQIALNHFFQKLKSKLVRRRSDQAKRE